MKDDIEPLPSQRQLSSDLSNINLSFILDLPLASASLHSCLFLA